MTLSQVLVEREILSPADVRRADAVRARTGDTLAATLLRLGMVEEPKLVLVLAEITGLPVLQGPLEADPDLTPALNPFFLRKRFVIPVKTEAGSVLVMADPQDDDTLAAIRFALGTELPSALAAASDIGEAWASAGENMPHNQNPVAEFDSEDDFARLADEGSEAPIIRLVQSLIATAVARRASDIHVEPMARHLVIRYRIDGRLIEVSRQSAALAGPIASRIKVMASLDIAESRLPQDGRLRATVRGRDVDVRVSTSPTAWGESIVLRLLGRSEVPLDLDALGLPEIALATLRRALARPHGMILLTGPTGSGKTTTLYAAINALRRPDVKILTVEDPVEILLEGVNQVQVRPDIDLNFAATLRAFLRQDPDILMVGEIRDRETADIALRAALTGHLVLSTLHTNSALGAFTRLADIGIEPYLAASTVIASIAQRLVRSVCPACATAGPPTDRDRVLFDRVGIPYPPSVACAIGCTLCGNSGYRGRIPLMEIVELDEDLREAIRRGEPEAGGSRLAPEHTLFGHGMALVAAGRTTAFEVERAVQLT